MGLYQQKTLSAGTKGDRENGTKWSKVVGLLLFYRWKQRAAQLQTCSTFKQREERLRVIQRHQATPPSTGPGGKAASTFQRAGPLCSFNMPSCHYPEPWGSWELASVPVHPEGGASSQRGGSPVLRPNGICHARSWANWKPITAFFFPLSPFGMGMSILCSSCHCILEAHFGFIGSQLERMNHTSNLTHAWFRWYLDETLDVRVDAGMR